MRSRDARRFISDDDIAEECDRGAQPDRVAVDPGDDRLLAGKDAPEYFLALLDALLELLEIERLAHIFNVAASAERAICAGDHEHLGLGIEVELPDQSHDIEVEFAIDAVEHFGTIQQIGSASCRARVCQYV